MGKRQPRKAVAQGPPSEPGKALSDSSDLDASNVGEVAQEGPSMRSTPRARAAPMQVEFEPEDSVTCQWEDCGEVFVHLPTLIDHIHNGASKSQGGYQCFTSSDRPYWRA